MQPGVALTWLYRRRHLLLPLLRHQPGENKIRWGQEVWPFQWRIAVSWLCGYFIFQLYNPVLFAFHGAVVAGQMGMSLTLANALQAIAISWIYTKAAPFGALIARKQYLKLDQLFFKALGQSVAVCGAGALAIWMGVIYLNWAGLPFAHRLLDPTSIAFLLSITTMNVVVTAEATYLRAHKQEKILSNFRSQSCPRRAISTFFLGRNYGAFGVVAGSLVTVGPRRCGLPLGTYTFLKYRRIWHAQ